MQSCSILFKFALHSLACSYHTGIEAIDRHTPRNPRYRAAVQGVHPDGCPAGLRYGRHVGGAAVEEEDIPAFHCYTGGVDNWKKRLHTHDRLCDHSDEADLSEVHKSSEDRVGILGMKIGKEEVIAVSCVWSKRCYCIRLLSFEPERTHVAFQSDRYYPRVMCQGQEGQMFVVHSVSDTPVIQLDCSTKTFHHLKTIHTSLKGCGSLAYISKRNLVVVCAVSEGVRAISCESKEQVWEVKGQVEGAELKPHGLAYHPGLDVVFVADGANLRFVILNGEDGSLRQVVPQPEGKKLGAYYSPCFHNGQMILHQGFANDTQKVSYFSVE